MADPNLRKINPQTPIFMAFLGGISFSALMLFIQSANTLKFVNILIPLTATISFLFVLITLGTMKTTVHKDFRDLIYIFTNIGMYGLMAIIPIAILSFNYYGALIVFIAEFLLTLIFHKISKKNPSSNITDSDQ